MTYLLSTHIAGIPCRIQYNLFPAIRGAREGGVPMEPDTQAGFEITEVLDAHGRPAPWLKRKMTPQDEDRILTQIEDIFGSLT